MTSRLISSFVRCSIPRVSFIHSSRFCSTIPLISRTLILRNLISKPCCAISIKSAFSRTLASENNKIKRGDENLLRVLESEIAEKGLTDFQFEISDNPEVQSITLKREYYGEQIQANVYKHHIHGYDEMSLHVTINKKVGPTLKFQCLLTPDDFKIRSMSLESSENSDEGYLQGPDFCDLDKSLQRAFEEYLATRGFKISLYNYLDDWITKDQRYFAKLGRLKEFIEK